MLVELVILTVLVVMLRKYLFKSRAEKLYDKMPGPKPYPIVGNLYEFNYPDEDPIVTLKNLSKKYGSVFLLRIRNEKVVCIGNPDDIEVVFSNNSMVNKPDGYKVFFPLMNQGLFTSSGEEWRKQRKLLTPAFHVSVLQSFISCFEKSAILLVKNLSEMVGKEFDVTKLMALCTFDIICETAMGYQTQVQIDKNSAFFNALDELLDILSHRHFSMIQNSFLFQFMSIGRRHNQLTKYVHEVTEEIIRKRREAFNTSNEMHDEDIDIGIKQKKPFLHLLLEYSSVGDEMTDLEIRQQVNTFMIAGFDTSQISMSITLYCLSHHPEIQEKVYQEIRKIFGEGDRDATYQDLQEMRYLENVIKESMRFYPVSGFIPRICCEDTKLKSGYVIPKNSTIAIMMDVMYHDPQVYPDPDTFDPDRWEKKNSLYSYLHFGGGIRNCIGQKFAMLEMKSVLSRIIRNYRILPSDIPLNLKYYIVARSSTGVNIRIEPRQRI